MKRITIVLALLLAASGLRAETCKVLSWNDRSVTVEFMSGEPDIAYIEPEGRVRLCRIDIPGLSTICVEEGEPLLPVGRFLFAVPADGASRSRSWSRISNSSTGSFPLPTCRTPRS